MGGLGGLIFMLWHKLNYDSATVRPKQAGKAECHRICADALLEISHFTSLWSECRGGTGIYSDLFIGGGLARATEGKRAEEQLCAGNGDMSGMGGQ